MKRYLLGENCIHACNKALHTIDMNFPLKKYKSIDKLDREMKKYHVMTTYLPLKEIEKGKQILERRVKEKSSICPQ